MFSEHRRHTSPSLPAEGRLRLQPLDRAGAERIEQVLPLDVVLEPPPQEEVEVVALGRLLTLPPLVLGLVGGDLRASESARPQSGLARVQNGSARLGRIQGVRLTSSWPPNRSGASCRRCGQGYRPPGALASVMRSPPSSPSSVQDDPLGATASHSRPWTRASPGSAPRSRTRRVPAVISTCASAGPARSRLLGTKTVMRSPSCSVW